MALLAYVVLSHRVPLDEATSAYLSSLRPIDCVAMLTAPVLDLLGTVMLFTLRRSAPWLFLAAFVVKWSLFLVVPGAGVSWHDVDAGFVIFNSVNVAVIVYAFRLRKQGVLV